MEETYKVGVGAALSFGTVTCGELTSAEVVVALKPGQPIDLTRSKRPTGLTAVFAQYVARSVFLQDDRHPLRPVNCVT